MGINPFRRGKSARRGMTVLAAATLGMSMIPAISMAAPDAMTSLSKTDWWRASNRPARQSTGRRMGQGRA